MVGQLSVLSTNAETPPLAGHNESLGRAGQLLDLARGEVDRFETDLVAAIDGTRAQQLRALAAVYHLHRMLESDGLLKEEFVRRHDMNAYLATPGRRPKYAAHGVVRLCVLTPERTRNRDFQRKVSVWAGAIAWAERNQVEPDKFVGFIENTDGGIDGAYRSEIAASSSKDERFDAAVRLREARNRYLSTVPPEPISDISFVRGVEAGQYLLVVEVDDQGGATAVARLSHGADRVQAMLDQHIVAWFADQDRDDLDE